MVRIRIWDPVPFWPLDSGSGKDKKIKIRIRNLFDPEAGMEKIGSGIKSRIRKTGHMFTTFQADAEVFTSINRGTVFSFRGSVCPLSLVGVRYVGSYRLSDSFLQLATGIVL